MIPGLGWRRRNTGIILSILGIKMNDTRVRMEEKDTGIILSILGLKINDTRVRMEKKEYWNNLVYSRNKDE